jgi:hypothetical protein
VTLADGLFAGGTDDDEHDERRPDAADVGERVSTEGGTHRPTLRRLADRGENAGEQPLGERNDLVAQLGKEAQQFAMPGELRLAAQALFDVVKKLCRRLAARIELALDRPRDLRAVEPRVGGPPPTGLN